MNTTIFSHRFSTRDHRVILVDFKLRDVAKNRVKIYSPGMRRLICENKAVVIKCSIKALELLQFHRIDKKLDRIEED